MAVRWLNSHDAGGSESRLVAGVVKVDNLAEDGHKRKEEFEKSGSSNFEGRSVGSSRSISSAILIHVVGIVVEVAILPCSLSDWKIQTLTFNIHKNEWTVVAKSKM